MLGQNKGKEQNMYSMLIAVGVLFTFISIILTYAIVNSVNKKLDKFERILQLQYAQIGGEDNYETILEISKLTKDQTKKQMDNYLATLKAPKAPKEPQVVTTPTPTPTPTSSKTIEITPEDLKAPIQMGK